MKKIVAIALILASAVAGAAGYKDWFTPEKGWTGYTVPVHIQFGSEGKDFDFPVTASLGQIMWVLDGGAEDVPQTAKNAYIISMSALANSIFSACQSQMNKVKIDNLGAALEGVFVSAYGQYEDERGNVITRSRSGVDTSKLRQQLIANKNAVVGGGQAAGGSEQNPLTIVVTQKPYDERQFEQHVENGRSLTSLKGWYGLDATGVDTGDYSWAFSLTDFWFPITSGWDGALSWGRWNGWNDSCFSAGDDVEGGENNQPLRLYGWTTANNCEESIQNLLTNETATTDRAAHKILTRYDAGNGTTIHWMPFDESVIGGSEGLADEMSIELSYDEDDYSEDEPKKFRLKGFDTAKPESETDGAVLPFVDATSDDLQWAGIDTFFSDSVFRKSQTTGKILLNGTSEEGKVKVLTMTGSGGDDQHISSVTFDNASIDGNPEGVGKVQLHGFDTAPSPYASGNMTFADALTNKTADIAGMSIPVRIPSQATESGVTVAYVPMGKIAESPAAAIPDDVTISTNETDHANELAVKGFYAPANCATTLSKMLTVEGERSNREKHWVLTKFSADGSSAPALHYVPIGDMMNGGKPDDVTVSTNETNHANELAIKGYYDATAGSIPHKGDSDDFLWDGIDYWVDGISIEANEDGVAQLAGFDTTSHGAIPYADGIVEALQWTDPPEIFGSLLAFTGESSAPDWIWTSSPNRYYGTDDSGDLDWHTLPTAAIPDGVTVSTNETGHANELAVKGFYAPANCTTTLSKMLTVEGERSNREKHWVLTKFAADGNSAPAWHYVPIGDMMNVDKPDDVTITTNETGHVGELAIKGFHDATATATNPAIPIKNDQGFAWVNFDDFYDNATIGKSPNQAKAILYGSGSAAAQSVPYMGANNKLAWSGGNPSAGAIFGYSNNAIGWQSTASHNRYYGTDNTGALGWHEMANVSTNLVEVDDRTLKSTISPNNSDTKIFSLYSEPLNEPSVARMDGQGHLVWEPVPIADIVTDGHTVHLSTNANNQIVLAVKGASDNSGKYLKSGGANADNSWTSIESDGESLAIDTTDTSKDVWGIKGWKTDDSCEADLAKMLTGKAENDRTSHELLARYGSGTSKTLHYLPINSLVKPGYALEFVGTGGGKGVVVGEGDKTNKVSFVSASGSNVSVTTEEDGSGGVKITIGTYWTD